MAAARWVRSEQALRDCGFQRPISLPHLPNWGRSVGRPGIGTGLRPLSLALGAQAHCRRANEGYRSVLEGQWVADPHKGCKVHTNMLHKYFTNSVKKIVVKNKNSM